MAHVNVSWGESEQLRYIVALVQVLLEWDPPQTLYQKFVAQEITEGGMHGVFAFRMYQAVSSAPTGVC